MQKALIVLGLVVVAAGIAWPWLKRLPLGRLPGDITIKGDNITFYFPLMTMLIVSIVLTVLFRLFK
jgi:hypothetical protein